MTNEYYIGLISGTSMDAVDTVLVDFKSKPKLIGVHSEPIAPRLKQSLLALCSPGENAINRMGETDIILGRLFAQSILTLLQKANVPSNKVCAIGSHGQTIRHVPYGRFPFTLQIGDPNTIASLTGITTVADFRRRDMALGGQAAPLTPAFHNMLFRNKTMHCWVLNIGGIANLTYLPVNIKEPVIGFDTGPGNTLIDAWCYQHLKKRLDYHGEWGAQGKVHKKLLAHLLTDEYFFLSPPKSTGIEYFNLNWLQEKINSIEQTPSAQDVQATLIELTAISIHDAIQAITPKPSNIWVCGGGVHNQHLISRLKTHCNAHNIASTAEAGFNPDWIEAICFAWLAQQTMQGKPGNLPSVTGASRASVLGAIYPA